MGSEMCIRDSTYFIKNMYEGIVMKPPRINLYTGRLLPPQSIPEIPKVQMRIFKPAEIIVEPIKNTLFHVIVFIYKLDYEAYKEYLEYEKMSSS